MDIAKLALAVLAQSAMFGPLTMLGMEIAKLWVRNTLPKTDPGFAAERKRIGNIRRLIQAGLSVLLPAIYQIAAGGVDWRTMPFVWLLAFAISYAGHRARNANEVADAGVTP